MIMSRRIQGLEALAAFGLPTPSWQVVNSLEDIKKLSIPEKIDGWTIRTSARTGKREFGLFYKNNVEALTVAGILEERLAQHGNDELYIIYPSWKFYYSFNIVYESGKYIVEGTIGSQKAISMGLEDPSFSFMFSRSPSLKVIAGDHIRSPFYKGVRRAIWLLRRLPFLSYYAEAAITLDQVLYFYDLFPIRDTFEAEAPLRL